jgi:hypothetical protein
VIRAFVAHQDARGPGDMSATGMARSRQRPSCSNEWSSALGSARRADCRRSARCRRR